ncbi:tetratricopeptide repeat protein [Sinimarinibacterium sp. CAU 1509]|uniref:tetratricopeptide repeat protein n=1 Tax=Sinimarinibacterium sp. CAU 1509 TaxID=2562283 RepID=UPI00146BEF79|nr:tetratricopeptide repeat protein [Sinimarinibacterium sp. CAU 1509]
MLLRRLFIVAATMALAACATTRGDKQIWPYPEPPIVSYPAPASEAPSNSNVGVGAPVVTPPQTAEAVSGEAVTALMRQARAALDAGHPDQAASSLERAIRIEPRNAFVWSLLGKTYLAQDNFVQAENVCSKSNALARGNPYVQLDNWRTIRAARAARGDGAGAAEAARQVDALEQSLSAYPAR